MKAVLSKCGEPSWEAARFEVEGARDLNHGATFRGGNIGSELEN
jgi:hypothetical protein